MHKFFIAIGLLISLNTIPNNLLLPKISDLQSSYVTAHRGSSGAAPENTLSAIRQAAAERAGYVEVDVQATADGVLVLMHDKNAKRTTGINKDLAEVTFSELRKADAGSWFDRKFKGEKVPTLEEAIDLAKELNVKLNLDLKNNGKEKRLAEKTALLLEKKEFVTQCVVTSFSEEMIKDVRRINGSIKIGLIISQLPQDPETLFANPNFSLLSANQTIVDEAFMKLANQYNKQVFVWTVNDQKEMERFYKLGVTSIITDYPERLHQVISISTTLNK